MCISSASGFNFNIHDLPIFKVWNIKEGAMAWLKSAIYDLLEAP
jgi:hypothetical protein